MAYEIVIDGVPSDNVRHRIAELVGGDRLHVSDGRLVVSLADQAAVLGALSVVNALGCPIDEVRRSER